MASNTLPNIWHLRTVAETGSKPCYVCYKPTTAVLITPDNKDFFYVCRGHLKDKGFCSPFIDEAEEAAKKKKAELDREIELLKKEHEEKMKKKEEKSKSKDADKDSKKEGKQERDKEDQQAEKEKDDKINDIAEKQSPNIPAEDIPRVYTLHSLRNIYQMRLDKIRNAEIARRNRERLSNPSFFPSVPSGNP